jgi:hypothetical protein
MGALFIVQHGPAAQRHRQHLALYADISIPDQQRAAMTAQLQAHPTPLPEDPA